jgi:3-(3-hydroxy-phenyl)propionate hydroxylase
MPSEPHYDVAIVGCGPVGAIFANLLAVYGRRIAIAEKAAEIYDKPRAITLDHEVLRIFQACGLGDFMEQSIAPHPGTHYLGVDGGVIKIFDPIPPPFPLAWTPTATFLQPAAERALRERLVSNANIDLLLETPVTAFEQDSQSVTLTVERGGRLEPLTARYLVACDGANSFVRKQLGIAHTDLAFDEQWIVVDALTSDPARRPDKCFQYCWPSRPGTYIPGPAALRRWEAKLLPGERAEEFSGNEKIFDVLRNFTDPSDLTLWRSAVYRFHALLAQGWRAGRIFLMGDAAHQTPPFLGQGFSAGARDAFNLAWKMEFVLSGKASDQLLDTYQIERASHVGTVVATAKAFGEIIGELDPEAAKKRDARLRDELRSGMAQTIRQRFIPDLCGGLIGSDAKLSGTLFIQPLVRNASGERCRLDDLLRPGFVIAAASPETLKWLSDDTMELWRRIGGELVVVAADPVQERPGVLTVRETEPLFAHWLKASSVAAVVVRPDRYVFGGAENAVELNNLVRELADKLARPQQGKFG